jgi:hypothetical protein
MRRNVPEELIVTQEIKKIPVINSNRIPIAVFTRTSLEPVHISTQF